MSNRRFHLSIRTMLIVLAISAVGIFFAWKNLGWSEINLILEKRGEEWPSFEVGQSIKAVGNFDSKLTPEDCFEFIVLEYSPPNLMVQTKNYQHPERREYFYLVGSQGRRCIAINPRTCLSRDFDGDYLDDETCWPASFLFR